ncbi:MAG: nucleoside monophosphate kinase [Verrucomicrobia bacterium]|nr:nucleoside monophosphate kinase [Verrucomicrobiota bacterium]
MAPSLPPGRNPYRTLLIFGAPGSGKGTQGTALGGIPRFVHFACGEVFRSLDTRTELGQAFLEYSSRGELVPDELTVKLWDEHIDRMVDAGRFKPDIDFLVLDGIPRNQRQAELMDSHISVERVFHLTCPDRDKLIARLKKRALKDNRLDDANEEVIRKRLLTYETETKPVLDFYKPRGLTKVIDATQPPVAVMKEILEGIMELGDLPTA